MAKSKLVNSGSRDQTPREMKVCTKSSRWKKSRAQTGEAVIARRFSFIAAISNYFALPGVQNVCINSKISCRAWMSLQSKRIVGIILKWIICDSKAGQTVYRHPPHRDFHQILKSPPIDHTPCNRGRGPGVV